MKIKRLFMTATLLAATLTACEDDFLDKKPLDQISDAAVWTDVNFAETFVNNIYTGLPNGYARGYYMLASATDEADNSYQWTQVEFFKRGDATAENFCQFGIPWDSQVAFGPWGLNYNYIRRCNLFLGNIGKLVTNAAPDEDKKKAITGEVLLLRALFYHELSKYYGGVPLITKAEGVDNPDVLLTPRNTYPETVAFILKDLDEAIALLPDTKYQGRAVRASAQALKGRVLLFNKQWAESAAASNQVVTKGLHSLSANYAALFATNNTGNPEILLDNQFLRDRRAHEVDVFNNPAGHGEGGWGGTSPTQNLVDKYEMTDGKPYDQSPLYNPAAPYLNREPRFYASILYDGAQWGPRRVQTRVGGRSGIDGGADGTNADATKTGYYMRKFLNEENIDRLYSGLNGGPSSNSWIILRLAEVLLNYAEAQNEAAGPDASVYDAVNAVRARVQLPGLPTGLDKAQMREKIRQERAVELAFEEHRFHDVRRWGLGDQIFNKPIFGMRISSDGQTFSRFKVEDRVFRDRDYLQPIPRAEMDKNSKLVQNPGW